MSEPVITETIAVLRRLVDWSRDSDEEDDRGLNSGILLKGIVSDAEGLLERYEVGKLGAELANLGYPWLAKALEEDGDSDKAIDIVYENLDELLRAGCFGTVDRLLRDCAKRSDSIPSEILLAILTLTSHAPSDRLSNRTRLVEATRAILNARGEWEPDALKGLE